MMIRRLCTKRAILALNGRRSFPSPYPSTSTARMFWGNGDSDDKKDDNPKDDKLKDEKPKDDKIEESDPTKKNDIKSVDNNSSLATLVPAPGAHLIPFGEPAPRMPHSLALPIVSRPLYPGLLTSITLSDEATISAMEELHKKDADDAYISCFLRSKDSTGMSEGGAIIPAPEIITDPSEIYHTGTLAQIRRFTRGASGGSTTVHNAKIQQPRSEQASSSSPSSATMILLPFRRVDLVSVDEIGPPVEVTVKHWSRMDYTNSNDTIRALSNEVISIIREVASMNPLFRDNLTVYPVRIDANDPFRLADFAASMSASASPEDLQHVLEEKHAEKRLQRALELLNREREISKLQREISEKVEEKMTDAQRKYFLTEQLKSIKKELGMERDDKEALIEKYRKQLATYPAVPEEAMETIEAELEKFSSLEKNSPEYNVTRSYLDWLTNVPWGISTDENYDIKTARTILDRDHYGLEDVKDTILQFIAIGKLKGSVQGKILCLAGPPGTGKTSIAKSVADALGRKFYRFSVGGLSDVSEIKGHRRTYIGAMPGKVIQCLKTTGTSNPVVLIDEIDKLGSGYRGDPSSALLEVLDPSQNSTFRDHFLDVPVDISKALFLCTANELERIPGPLLDRMEVIRLSGYDFPEKVEIAEQYLIPKSFRESGLMVEKKDETPPPESEEQAAGENTAQTTEEHDATTTTKSPDVSEVEAKTEEIVSKTPLDNYVHAEGVPETLRISTEAVHSLSRWYAREAGVRNLAKYIDKITGKLALQVVAEDVGAKLTEKTRRKTDSWAVTEDNLADYVGKPVFTSDRLYEEGPLPTGIVMGLAYTSMGGTALYIETQAIKRSNDADGKSKGGGGSLKVTGQLGDVMKESAQIATTVARARLAKIDPESSFFDQNDMHMHVPEGATPKDGPSAGVTMTTAMLSLATGKSCRNDVAMTGEISLTGKVLPVGGIKEKIMAARRARITTIVLPFANKRDFEEIPDYLKDGLTVFFAEDYQDVYDVAFRNA